jgi:hypothetical protein
MSAYLREARRKLRKQTGKTTLENAVKFLNGLCRHPERFLHNSFLNDWQLDVLSRSMRHLDEPEFFKEKVVPDIVRFLETSWANREEGKQWKLPVVPQAIFDLRQPERSKWASLFKGWVEEAKPKPDQTMRWATLKDMQDSWVGRFQDQDKYAKLTFNKLVRKNSQIKTIFPDASNRRRGRPKGNQG